MDDTGPGGASLSDSCMTLRTGLALTHLSVHALWLEYAAFGGQEPYGRVNDALAGRLVLADRDHNLLALALNQHVALQGSSGVVRYAPDLNRSRYHPSRPPT